MSGQINFYLYFPTESAARHAATELEKRGYSVETRLGADETNWLSLAKRRGDFAPSALSQLEQELNELAASFEGEYDGYERDVPT